MTDLTEQWKKGELPSGMYYIKDTDGNIYPTENCLNYDVFNDKAYTGFYYAETGISEILAPVPSYDEYMIFINDNKRLKHDIGNLGYKIKNQRKEIEKQIEQNAQLKEYERIVKSYYGKPIDYDIACETVDKLLDEKKFLKEEISAYKRLTAQLKELLKECRRPVCWYVDIFKNKAELLTKIDEVLR